MKKFIVLLILITLPLLLWQCGSSKSEDQNKMTATKESPAKPNIPAIPDTLVKKVTDALVAKHGNTIRERARRGVSQIAKLWQKNDGSDAEFETFCLKHFIASVVLDQKAKSMGHRVVNCKRNNRETSPSTLGSSGTSICSRKSEKVRT